MHLQKQFLLKLFFRHDIVKGPAPGDSSRLGRELGQHLELQGLRTGHVDGLLVQVLVAQMNTGAGSVVPCLLSLPAHDLTSRVPAAPTRLPAGAAPRSRTRPCC
jgi:hypothetical protein